MSDTSPDNISSICCTFSQFFIIWVAYRFGNIRLGDKDSQPEFDDMTYFAMLFSAGIGVGLFFYGGKRAVSLPPPQFGRWDTHARAHP